MPHETAAQRNARSAERRSRRCRHFTGLMQDACKAGVNYREAGFVPAKSQSLACFAEVEPQPCPHYAPNTPEELAAERAEQDRVFAMFTRDLSPCCEAPLDKRRVIPDGPHKGHGPRFCSKCGKMAYMV